MQTFFPTFPLFWPWHVSVDCNTLKTLRLIVEITLNLSADRKKVLMYV